jgi:hypothetical protein
MIEGLPDFIVIGCLIKLGVIVGLLATGRH